MEKNHRRFLIGDISYNSYCLQRKLRVISWRDNVFVQQNCFFWLDREYVDLQNRVWYSVGRKKLHKQSFFGANDHFRRRNGNWIGILMTFFLSNFLFFFFTPWLKFNSMGFVTKFRSYLTTISACYLRIKCSTEPVKPVTSSSMSNPIDRQEETFQTV